MAPAKLVGSDEAGKHTVCRTMLRPALCATLVAAALSADAAGPGLPPKLAALLERARAEPAALAEELRLATHHTRVQAADFAPSAAPMSPAASLPIVVAHGMGDSCFNAGMKQITQQAGQHAGVYSTCIPTGDNDIEDTLAGFLTNMDKSVEIFARKVRADPKLANGFNAFGLSQGNNLIHGYQLKYNDPPVVSFISVCGINAGVGAIPQCSPNASSPILGPTLGPVCEALAEVTGDAANLKIVQDVLFQANYYRDPSGLNHTEYLRNNQLAQWNGEGVPGTFNQSFKENFLKTSTNVWVKGLLDTVVWPREGEWWGQVAPGHPWDGPALPMAQSSWYLEDTFGLRTASQQNKNHFESFMGEHIRIPDAQLYSLISKYFK
jgi:palmitoyl-protein thioesterase